MNKFALVGSMTLLLLTAISPVSAGPADFMSNADGSWSPTHVYIYATPNITNPALAVRQDASTDVRRSRKTGWLSQRPMSI